MRPLVAEQGAVDTFLPAVIDELPPNKDGVSGFGAEDEFFTGTDEQFALASVAGMPRGIVTLVEGETLTVAVFREPPHRLHHTPQTPPHSLPKRSIWFSWPKVTSRSGISV